MSLVERLTFVKLVLMTTLNYFMATVKVSITVCKEIEKLACGFLRGSSGASHKPSLVSWKGRCRSVSFRGLEIRQLQVQNKLFLMKLRFNLITPAFWVQVVRNKYGVFGLIPDDTIEQTALIYGDRCLRFGKK